MCKCTPEIRTPFCGKPGCEWPVQVKQDKIKQEKHALIKAYQSDMIKHGLWFSCLNCDYWSGNQCNLFNKVPPPKIIVHSCEEWKNEIPF